MEGWEVNNATINGGIGGYNRLRGNCHRYPMYFHFIYSGNTQHWHHNSGGYGYANTIMKTGDSTYHSGVPFSVVMGGSLFRMTHSGIDQRYLMQYPGRERL